MCVRSARVPSRGVSRSPSRSASPTTAGASPCAHLPWLSAHVPRRVCAEPSLARPCLCAGLLPLGTTGLASTAHAVTSLRLRHLSCSVSHSVVRCSRRTSAPCMAAAVSDCRNSQEEIGLPAPRRPSRSLPWPRLPSSLCFALRLPLPLSSVCTLSVLGVLSFLCFSHPLGPSWLRPSSLIGKSTEVLSFSLSFFFF